MDSVHSVGNDLGKLNPLPVNPEAAHVIRAEVFVDGFFKEIEVRICNELW